MADVQKNPKDLPILVTLKKQLLLKFLNPFLTKHIDIINPKILVLLGSTALNTIIGNEEVISKANELNVSMIMTGFRHFYH